MRLLLAIWLISATSIAAAAAAPEMPRGLNKCKFPDPPTLLSGTEASADEMKAAGKSVRSYVNVMQDSLACIDKVQAKLDDKASDEQKAMLTTMYNNGVDQLNSVAGQYNDQVKAFKAK